MSTRSDARSRKIRKTRSWKYSPQASAQILATLFVYLPMAIGLLVAWWAGWGVDGWLFSTIIGGILGGALLFVVLLVMHGHPRKRKKRSRKAMKQ